MGFFVWFASLFRHTPTPSSVPQDATSRVYAAIAALPTQQKLDTISQVLITLHAASAGVYGGRWVLRINHIDDDIAAYDSVLSKYSNN